jgi:class 3 adenylate cyclase
VVAIAFLLIYMLFRTSDDSNGKLHSTSQDVYASVLFADISGFTKLASLLSAECLKRNINDYFTNMLAVVSVYGGDVVKFCGDAVLMLT